MSIVDISTLLKNIDIDKDNLENIDIDIDKDYLENIDIDKNISKILISISIRTFWVNKIIFFQQISDFLMLFR